MIASEDRNFLDLYHDANVVHNGLYFLQQQRSSILNLSQQTNVTLSAMNAKYISLSDASWEVIIRLQLFKNIWTSTDIATIFSDNQGTLMIAMNSIDH